MEGSLLKKSFPLGVLFSFPTTMTHCQGMVFGFFLVLFVVVDAAMAATDFFCIAKSCKSHKKKAPKVHGYQKNILV